jgi:UDP-N-acetylmuramoyl-L-alanyl-D-glutamate--2,6-diaminopimelate ligase
MRTLAELFNGIPAELTSGLGASDLALRITAVTSDSRLVKPGCVFVAVRGVSSDGHGFISDAVSAGASVVVGEDANDSTKACPYVRVPDSRLMLARMAANFSGNPSHGMIVVGVTGTSGKTTTTYLIESILKAAGYEVGVLGTVNVRYRDKVLDASHTTPGPVELQALLAQMKDAGCTAVVMEVSSHALKQRRTAFIVFDAVVFTNLSPEHLDYHPDMEDYYQSKKLLFTEAVDASVGKNTFAAVNEDDAYGIRLVAEIRNLGPNRRVKTFGLIESADFSGSMLEVGLSGVSGVVDGINIQSLLPGRFNASNILAAFAVGRGLGVDDKSILRGISTLQSVSGRLERVPNECGIHVLVDYAHKPDALEKVLKALAVVREGHRLITVFGCGGDRDRTKRPVMGRLAVELSDLVFITSDNPRTESPEAIVHEILNGVAGFSNYRVEPDRRKAIHSAIRAARPGDLVLIAGKGHEDYQIISDPAQPGGIRKIHFDDREVAAEAIASL